MIAKLSQPFSSWCLDNRRGATSVDNSYMDAKKLMHSLSQYHEAEDWKRLKINLINQVSCLGADSDGLRVLQRSALGLI